VAIFTIGKVYTFNTLAPSLLGATLTNMKLKSILDFDTVSKLTNIELQYRRIYPLLPINSVNDPKATVYYVFKAESGSDVIIAEQWVDQPTITEITSINFRVNISNTTLQDMNTLRDILNSMGITNYTIDQV